MRGMWLLGDARLRAPAAALAASDGPFVMVDSTEADVDAATTRIMHTDARVLRSIRHQVDEGYVFVLVVAEEDFDSEALINRIEWKVPPTWKIGALLSPTNNLRTREGYEHEICPQIQMAELTDLEPATIEAAMRELIARFGELRECSTCPPHA